MAAVAGAVADEILPLTAQPLNKGYVNNGGDTAFHLEEMHILTRLSLRPPAISELLLTIPAGGHIGLARTFALTWNR